PAMRPVGAARGPRAVLTRGPNGPRTLGSLLVVEWHSKREEGPLSTVRGEPCIDQLARANAGHRHGGRRRDHEPLLILDHDLAARIVDIGHTSQPDLRLIGCPDPDRMRDCGGGQEERHRREPENPLLHASPPIWSVYGTRQSGTPISRRNRHAKVCGADIFSTVRSWTRSRV